MRDSASAAPLTALLAADQVSRSFAGGRGVHAVSLRLLPGEFVALTGASGAGKTTLLRLLAGLDQAAQGRVLRDGVAVRRLRRGDTRVAMVFQRPRLRGRATALQNVLAGRLGQLPRWRGLLGRFSASDLRIALTALDQVGLLDRADTRADVLSGGEQQRVSIARALAQQPQVLLADEPVSSLDPDNAHRVLGILKQCSREGLAVLTSLHQPELAHRYAGRVLCMQDGRLSDGVT